MNTFKEIRENNEALQELLHQNECQANKAVAVFLLTLVVGTFFMAVPAFLNATSVLVAVPYLVVFCTNATGAIIAVRAWRQNFDAPWIKHWLVGFFIVVLAFIIGLTPEYSLYLLPVALFISVRYFDLKFSLRVAVWTMVLFIAMTALNLWLHAISPEVVAYHNWMESEWWDYPINTVTSWFLPPAITFGFLAWYAVGIAKSSASLIRNFAQKSSEMNAVETELGMASQIQMSSLPAPFFTAPGGNFSLAANETTAREVGGDFYDYYMLDDSRLAVLIADVSDKGAPAALFMMSAKKTLRCAIECSANLEEALTLATRLVCEDNQSDMFFTLWVAVIDVRTGRGRYANAGHPLPYLKHRDGTVDVVDNNPDLFIGNFPDIPPCVHTFQMVPGDTLLLFTDGITDAESTKGTRFQEQGIENVLQSTVSGAQPTMEAVVSSARTFSQGMAQFDDMTVVALECLNVDEPKRLSLCLPACTASGGMLLDATEEFAAEVGCPDSVRRKLELIIDEITENISMYAYEDVAEEAAGSSDLAQDELGIGRMQVDMEMGANYALLRFQDCGTPFDPIGKADPDLDGELRIGGLGIYLVKNCIDEIHYERVKDRNVLDVLLLWNV